MIVRKFLSKFAMLALLLFIAVSAPSCAKVKRVVLGDPRKNVNHPKHGEWVREKRMKKEGY